MYEYPDNSTERMLGHLRDIPEADLAKLRTIDASTEALAAGDVPGQPALCLIDGEHTNAAAARDARFCRAVLGDVGTIVFHDCQLVAKAIAGFLRDLGADGLRFTAYPLPDLLFVVELGEPRLTRSAAIGKLLDAGGGRRWQRASALPGARRLLAAMLWSHARRVSAEQERQRS